MQVLGGGVQEEGGANEKGWVTVFGFFCFLFVLSKVTVYV